MMQAQTIQQLIQQGLPDANVQVNGDDGAHFEAVVVDGSFTGMSMLQQHRAVYATLGEAMGDAIHALGLKTYSPEAYAKVNASNPANNDG